MYHNYGVTAHIPSKVLHTQVGNFMGGDENNLLIRKVAYVDAYAITKEGLVAKLELQICSRMAIIKLTRFFTQRIGLRERQHESTCSSTAPGFVS